MPPTPKVGQSLDDALFVSLFVFYQVWVCVVARVVAKCTFHVGQNTGSPYSHPMKNPISPMYRIRERTTCTEKYSRLYLKIPTQKQDFRIPVFKLIKS